ncbi:MAG: hypothetical protein AAB710_02185 [Patescibacteria group bacterium]
MQNIQISLSTRREFFIAVATFLASALFFISLSVFATSIGTDMDSTGTLGAATSTPWGDLAVDQVAGKGRLRPVFVVGDNATSTPFIFVSQKGVVGFGSSTPSDKFLNAGDVVIGRGGATGDLFVSGGLGVGLSTTTDYSFIAGGTNGLTVLGGGTTLGTASGDVIIGATTSTFGFVVEKPQFMFSTGGTGTSTLSVLNEAAANGANSCIEMSSDGLTYRIMIDGAGTALLVEAGNCSGS